MPHTNREKKASGPVGADFKHSNRRNVRDGAGWSHVVNIRGGAGGRKAARPTVNLPTQNGEYTYANCSIAQMQKNLAYYSEKWAGDRASQELHMMLDDSNSGVENVICLGLGSLHNANMEGQRASWIQLVALRAILDTLGDIVKSPVVFQDPAFSALDKEFLSSLGYNVVNPPFAWDKVTRGSLVYGIHCYNDVIRSVLDDMRPAMMIRNILHSELWNPETHGNQAYHTQLRSEYHEDDFPQLRNSNAFSDTKIYWRNLVKPATPPTTPPPNHQSSAAIKSVAQESSEIVDQQVLAVASPSIAQDSSVKVAKPEASTVISPSTVEESNSKSTPKLLQVDTSAAILSPVAEEFIADKNLYDTNSPPVTTRAPSSSTKAQRGALDFGSVKQEVVSIVSDRHILGRRSASPTSVGGEASKAASLSSAHISPSKSNSSRPTNTPPAVQAQLVQQGNSPGSSRSSSSNTTLRRQQRAYMEAKAAETKARRDAEDAVYCEIARKQAETFAIWLRRRSTSPTNTDTKKQVILEDQTAQKGPPTSFSGDLIKKDDIEESGAADISQEISRNLDAGSQEIDIVEPELAKVSDIIVHAAANEGTRIKEVEKSNALAVNTDSLLETRAKDASNSDGAVVGAGSFEDAKVAEVNNPAALVVGVEIKELSNSGAPAIDTDALIPDAELIRDSQVEGTESNIITVKSVLAKDDNEVVAPILKLEVVEVAGEIPNNNVSSLNEPARDIMYHTSKESVAPELEKKVSTVDKSTADGAVVIEKQSAHISGVSTAFETVVIAENTITDSTEHSTDVEDIPTPKVVEVLTELKDVIADETVTDITTFDKQLARCSLEEHSPTSSIVASEFIENVIVAGKMTTDAVVINEVQLAPCVLDDATLNNSVAPIELVDKVAIAAADDVNYDQQLARCSLDAQPSNSSVVAIEFVEKAAKVIETAANSDAVNSHAVNSDAVNSHAVNSDEEQLARCSLDDQHSNSSVVAIEPVEKVVVVVGQAIADKSGGFEIHRDVTDGYSRKSSIVEETENGKVVDGAPAGISDSYICSPGNSDIDIMDTNKLVERSTADTSNFNEGDLARDFTDDQTSGTSVTGISAADEEEPKTTKVKHTKPYKITIQAAKTATLTFKSIKFHGPIMMKSISVGDISFGEVSMPNGLVIEVSKD